MKTGMTKRQFMPVLQRAIREARHNMTLHRGSLYARGLSTEGFDGGYYQALIDVDALLHHGYPADSRGVWRRAMRGPDK